MMKVVGLEYRSLKRRAMEFDRAIRQERSRLIQWAQAGDPTALAVLRERYRLRLPLVEERMEFLAARRMNLHLYAPRSK
jgi:hypothetical protein